EVARRRRQRLGCRSVAAAVRTMTDGAAVFRVELAAARDAIRACRSGKRNQQADPDRLQACRANTRNLEIPCGSRIPQRRTAYFGSVGSATRSIAANPIGRTKYPPAPVSSEGLRPSDSPTRSLARRFAGSRRSASRDGGPFARLARGARSHVG